MSEDEVWIENYSILVLIFFAVGDAGSASEKLWRLKVHRRVPFLFLRQDPAA
jgi:hypothetical protein